MVGHLSWTTLLIFSSLNQAFFQMFGLTLQADTDQFQNLSHRPPNLLAYLMPRIPSRWPKLVVPQLESWGLHSKCLTKMQALYDHKMSVSTYSGSRTQPKQFHAVLDSQCTLFAKLGCNCLESKVYKVKRVYKDSHFSMCSVQVPLQPTPSPLCALHSTLSTVTCPVAAHC